MLQISLMIRQVDPATPCPITGTPSGLSGTRSGDVELFMQKVPRGDGVSIWKISNATVSLIPDLYETYGYSESIEDFRRALPQVTFLGFELFKWVCS